MVNNDGLKIYTIVIISLILVFYGVSVGINLTGFALFLNQSGFSKIQIGHILSMELAGNLMIAPILPKISEYFGIFKVMFVALIIRSICLIMFAESSIIAQHMMWLFGFGVSGFALFASIQYWGASIARGVHKSTIISLFNVAFGVGGVGTVCVLAASRQWRRDQRAKDGRCPDCGYDLRGTVARCPECGAGIE